MMMRGILKKEKAGDTLKNPNWGGPLVRFPRGRSFSFLILLALCMAGLGTGGLEAQTPSAQALFREGQAAMLQEDWYAAAEALLECLRANPAHAEGNAALAECYYELGEFDQALSWVRKARSFSRNDMGLANLEASILIALGRLDDSSTVISGVLSREPYNKEALFAAAELDIARGRSGEAVSRYREVVRRYPDDRRVLVSLALVLGSLGDMNAARGYIERALVQHPGDYRVYYYAAYLDARFGSLDSAIAFVSEALTLRPGYAPARNLLASLRYRTGSYDEAARLADEAIAADRNDVEAWYLKGMAYSRLGRFSEAITVLSLASAIDPEDEFVRSALEELLISNTGLEDPARGRWASWHFNRARDFRSRNLNDQALFEYRRALRINPYARERRDYAELLRLQGYPARYLAELKFMQSLGTTDQAVSDAVENYDSLLSGALHRIYGIDPVEVSNPHWKVAVFSVNSQSGYLHTDGALVAASYIRDLLIHDRSVSPMEINLRQGSFSQAFRSARETGADYFMIVSIAENERDLSLKGELFVGRTGSPAGTFSVYRTGADRLRNASRSIIEQLDASLPFRGELILRRASEGIIDKGRLDGVAADTVYEVVKKGRPVILNEGISLQYSPSDVVGSLTISRLDEEISLGVLSRNGFFDRIAPGDEIILQKQKPESARPVESIADPELRTLLRTLR